MTTLKMSDITPSDAAETGDKIPALRGTSRVIITAGQIGALAEATAAGALALHEAAGNPHPGYLTPAEGNAAYDAIGAASAAQSAAQSYADSAVATHAGASDPHPGYTTAAELAAAVSFHEAAADPHPGYLTATALAIHEAAGNPHPGYLTPAEGAAAYDAIGAAAAAQSAAQSFATSAIATHAGESNPHPTYLTQAEGDAAYAPIAVTAYTDEMARDAIGAALVAGSNINIIVDDGANTITVEATSSGSLTVDEVTLDFGTRPVSSKAFTFALVGASISERVLMTASGASDELEFDGFACAARVSATDEITAYISAIPGPVAGQRVFNIVRG